MIATSTASLATPGLRRSHVPRCRCCSSRTKELPLGPLYPAVRELRPQQLEGRSMALGGERTANRQFQASGRKLSPCGLGAELAAALDGLPEWRLRGLIPGWQGEGSGGTRERAGPPPRLRAGARSLRARPDGEAAHWFGSDVSQRKPASPAPLAKAAAGAASPRSWMPTRSQAVPRASSKGPSRSRPGHQNGLHQANWRLRSLM